MSLSKHGKLHAKPKPMIALICDYCGITFEIQLSHYKHRIKIGQKKFFHDKSCAGKMKNPPHKENYSSIIKNKLDLINIINEGILNGLNGPEIAKNNHLNRKTVYTWIKKLHSNYPLRKNHTSDFKLIIQEGLQKGLTGAEIARNNNTSKSTVYRWIDTMGITK
jgi:DNA invertase Pin-like site-specific DNA recombinase